jgi:RimJ/RimL family protein N-acetyltransferase
MTGTTHVREPLACTADERRAFARLVRVGFEGSDAGLDGRIRDAKLLAFHFTIDDTLGAVAALKAPTDQYRDYVFTEADASVSPADCRLELGWVFVVPEYRGNHIAKHLCRVLLQHVPTPCAFATTRPDNVPMIRTLRALGFARVGKPFLHPRRTEELVVFCRS